MCESGEKGDQYDWWLTVQGFIKLICELLAIKDCLCQNECIITQQYRLLLPVKADDFLPQNSIHRLPIHDWVYIHHHLCVKVWGELRQDVFCKLLYYFLHHEQETAQHMTTNVHKGFLLGNYQFKMLQIAQTWGDLAPLPVCLGKVSRTPSKSWLVSWLSLVMSALLWSPNTQGSLQSGRPRM